MTCASSDPLDASSYYEEILTQNYSVGTVYWIPVTTNNTTANSDPTVLAKAANCTVRVCGRIWQNVLCVHLLFGAALRRVFFLAVAIKRV